MSKKNKFSPDQTTDQTTGQATDQATDQLIQTAYDLNLPLGGADSHAHLDDSQYANDLGEVLSRAYRVGVAYIGNVFSCAQAWQAGKTLFVNPAAPLGSGNGLNAANKPEVFFQLGIHPNEASLWSPAEERAITEAVGMDVNIKAIGEIGLDYYWKDQPPALQQAVFVAQLKLAKKLDLPVSIHSRAAEQDTLAILQAQGFKDYPVLWHCFGADAELAQFIIGQGWHISVPGTASFKKNIILREALPLIPLTRLHLESDCPYLTPEPFRGKRNEPAYVAFTAQVVAKKRSMDIKELWIVCGNNTKTLFGL